MTQVETTWRALEPNEVALLDALTSLEFDGATELRAQIAAAEARPGCECGCGTIALRVDEESAPRANVSRQPVRGEAEVEADPPGGLILFAKDGYLSCLEVYSYGDPLPLPTPAEIRPYVRGE